MQTHTSVDHSPLFQAADLADEEYLLGDEGDRTVERGRKESCLAGRCMTYSPAWSFLGTWGGAGSVIMRDFTVYYLAKCSISPVEFLPRQRGG